MEKLQNTLAENLKGGNVTAKPGHRFTLEEVPPQDGKVAVVTGGSEGIGYGCTHTLLKHNISKLFILSLSKDVVAGAFDAVKEELGEEAANKTIWYHCDLTDWKEVTEVADKIRKNTDRLDILINNAGRGIMTAQQTELGVDRHMALNHMGHVILTSHLLPLLKDTASKGNTVRIGNTASNAHEQAPTTSTHFSSLDEMNHAYDPMSQYGRSKLANILYTRYLNKHLTSAHPNILVNCVHPGVVETKMSAKDIHEPYPLAGYGMNIIAPIKKDAFEGAISMMYVATTTNKSGEYICPPAVPESGSKDSQDMENAERLMKITKEIVMEKTKPDSVDKGCPFQMY